MQEFKVGESIGFFVGHHDQVYFDIDNGGAVIYVCFKSPEESEINQFKADKPFEIRYVRRGHILMMLLKFGNLNWMDAPYNPTFSPNLTEIVTAQEGQGLSTIIVLIDSRTGEIKQIRMIGLSTRFTNNLFREIAELKAQPCPREKYDAEVQHIYENYMTSHLVKLSSEYCKIHGSETN